MALLKQAVLAIFVRECALWSEWVSVDWNANQVAALSFDELGMMRGSPGEVTRDLCTTTVQTLQQVH